MRAHNDACIRTQITSTPDLKFGSFPVAPRRFDTNVTSVCSGVGGVRHLSSEERRGTRGDNTAAMVAIQRLLRWRWLRDGIAVAGAEHD